MLLQPTSTPLESLRMEIYSRLVADKHLVFREPLEFMVHEIKLQLTN